MALLDWLRESGVFDRLLLKDFTEDGFRVQIFGDFGAAFAADYEARARVVLRVAEGGLDEQRRLLLLGLLAKRLEDGPPLTDVELQHGDYALEEPEDFAAADDVCRIPTAAFLFFALERQQGEKKRAKTATADDPESDSGGPRYVVPDVVAPEWVLKEDRADFDPDWRRWKPNPEVEHVAPLLDEVIALITPARPIWRLLAAELNGRGHVTLTGRPFTEANVWRVVVAAELLLGNERPDTD
jgi:hypothetical protein